MGPALESAAYELPLLDKLLPDLIKVGGEALASRIRHFQETALVNGEEIKLLSLLPSTTKQPCLRKLAYFSDKEGKTRVVGILDY